LKRGDIFRVYGSIKPDPKNYRCFVIVSRAALLKTKFSSVICAPVYSKFENISTQVKVGIKEGLKKNSAVFCDNLVSIEKSRLTNYVGSLDTKKMRYLDQALTIALDLY
jgi:mRNA interferase MazF